MNGLCIDMYIWSMIKNISNTFNFLYNWHGYIINLIEKVGK